MNFAAEWDEEHRKRLMWPEAVDGRVVMFVRRLAPKTKPQQLRILDVGCGAGANALWLASRGYRVSGFDASKAAVFRAHGKLKNIDPRPDVVAHDLTTAPLPYSDNRFDAAIDVRTLENLDGREATTALIEIARVLKPGGQLLSITAHADRDDGLTTVGMVRKMNEDQMRALCIGVGFSALDCWRDAPFEDGKRVDDWRIVLTK